MTSRQPAPTTSSNHGRRSSPAGTARRRAGRSGARSRRRCRAAGGASVRLGADAGSHGLVARRGLGRVGDADDLAELDRQLDRSSAPRQALLLVGVEQRSGRRGRRGPGRASTRGWPRRGCPSTCPARRTAASGARRRRRGTRAPSCHRVGDARLERVDGVAFDASVGRVHVPRLRAASRRSLLSIELVERLVGQAHELPPPPARARRTPPSSAGPDRRSAG